VRKRTLNRQRTARACLSCVEAKLRCNDVRPCERCVFKGITCQAAKLRHSSNINDEFRVITQRKESLDKVTPPGASLAIHHGQEYTVLPSTNQDTLPLQNIGPMSTTPTGPIEDQSTVMLGPYDTGMDTFEILPSIVDGLQVRMSAMICHILMSITLTNMLML